MSRVHIVSHAPVHMAAHWHMLRRTCCRYSYFFGWLLFTGATVGLSVFAVACCHFIAPAAAGSGIPDVVAYLNGVDVPAILLFRTLVAKILGSLGSVGGGLAVGKEGPFVHIGACIASVLSQVRGAPVAQLLCSSCRRRSHTCRTLVVATRTQYN